MNLSNIIIQGGLQQRSVEDYDEQRNARGHAQLARKFGVRQMENTEALMPVESNERRMQLEDVAQQRGDKAAYRGAASAAAQGAPEGQKFTMSLDAIAAEAAKRGDVNTANTARKTKAMLEQEGVKELTMAALTGRQGPELEEIYQRSGRGRVDPGSMKIDGSTGVLTAMRNGQPFQINLKDTAVLLGLVKKPEDKIIPQGGALARDGKITAVNTAGLEAKSAADFKKLDHEYGLKRNLETFKKAHGTESATALMRNMEYLVKSGVAKDYTEAYKQLRTTTERSEGDAASALASRLMQSPRYRGAEGPQRAMKDALGMVRSVRGAEADDGEASAGVNQPFGSAAPRTRAAMGQYNLRGKSFSDADIDETAKKYGISTDQVKQKLGIR